MKFVASFVLCAVGLMAQNAIIPTASVCPAGQLLVATPTGTLSTYTLVSFSCLSLSPTVTIVGNLIISTAAAPLPSVYSLSSQIIGNGQITQFPIAAQPANFAIVIFKNGVPLSSATDFTITGTSLTFTVAPLATDTITIFSTILLTF